MLPRARRSTFAEMRVLILAALTLVACRSMHDPRTEALFAADRAFSADVQARRLEGWVAAFDGNGSQFDDDFRPVTGHAAIRARMAPFFADPANSLEWEPDTATMSEAGGLGSTSGRFTMSRRRDDGTREILLTGRYFDVWRKQPDGTWKLVLDLGEPDAAPVIAD